MAGAPGLGRFWFGFFGYEPAIGIDIAVFKFQASERAPSLKHEVIFRYQRLRGHLRLGLSHLDLHLQDLYFRLVPLEDQQIIFGDSYGFRFGFRRKVGSGPERKYEQQTECFHNLHSRSLSR